MDEPVGNAVGNVLEIQETINCLNGKMPKDVEETVTMLRKCCSIISLW